jgi:hypothetical protein
MAEEWLNSALANRSHPHAALLYLERAFECGLDGAHPEVATFAGSTAFDDLMRLYGGPKLCGYLEKQSDSPLRLWRRRWVVRRGSQLMLFTTHDEKSHAVPVASIDLLLVGQMTRSPREPLRFDLVLRSGAAHRWRAATRAEADRWVQALSEVLSGVARRKNEPPPASAPTKREQLAALVAPAHDERATISVPRSLLAALCDEVSHLEAQVAALQRQLAAAADTRTELMKAREQLDDLTFTITELSQRDALATTPGDRKLHAMSLLAEVDQLAIAARKKKQPTPPAARATLYGTLEEDGDDHVADHDDDDDDADLCMRCHSSPACLLVQVDDQLPERLCELCTAQVQQEADEKNRAGNKRLTLVQSKPK